MASRLALLLSAAACLALAGPACVVAQPDGPTAQVTPSSGPPGGPPPPPSATAPDGAYPPDAYPPDTSAPPPPQAQAGVPQGQWVYTQQYGWVWMTYGDTYVYV